MKFFQNLFKNKQKSEELQLNAKDVDVNGPKYSCNIPADVLEMSPIKFRSLSEADTPKEKISLTTETEDNKDNDTVTTAKQENMRYLKYKIQQGDTLFGLALAFDISPHIIKQDNGIFEDVFPGQTIKIRVNSNWEGKNDPNIILAINENQANEMIQKVNDDQVEEVTRNRILSLKDLKIESAGIYEQYNAEYLTNFGSISGYLKISPLVITFEPIKFNNIELSDTKKDNQIQHFKMLIDRADIHDTTIIPLPNKCCDYEITNKEEIGETNDYLLHMSLIGVGLRSKFGKYVDKLFKDMRKNDIPFASVYFKLGDNNKEHGLTLEEKKNKINSIIESSQAVKSKLKDERTRRSTSIIPFYDVIYDQFSNQDAILLSKITARPHHVYCIVPSLKSKSSSPKKNDQEALTTIKPVFTAKLSRESTILNQDQFNDLMAYVPYLYRDFTWKPVYINVEDGTTMLQLMRKSKNCAPLLIIVQDEFKFSFGAYANESIREATYLPEYYGSGECFIFTFRDTKELTAFSWSKKNTYFMLTDKDGLYFGAGDYYGLWISNDLTRGRSFKSATYDNAPLSLKTDFEILKIEVWTIQTLFQDYYRQKTSNPIIHNVR